MSKVNEQLAALNKSMEAANALIDSSKKAFELTTSLLENTNIQYKDGEGNATAADVQLIQAKLNALFAKAKNGKSVAKESLNLAKEVKQKFKK